jgi:hypothetical protein
VVATTALLLAGCAGGGTLDIDAPAVRGADAAVCRALLAAVPARVADQARRTSEDGAGFGAAWGDPAIVLTCGVPRPKGLDAFAACTVANGVGWYLPASQGQDEPVDMTTVGRAVRVEVEIPAEYFPPATTMADLAPALRRTVPQVRPCG